MTASDARPLFIFELANNHMGRVEHGLRIIQECGAVIRDFDFRFAFKLQFRNLETFIHPDYHERIGFIKDIAAGAVFFAALTAITIGCIIYFPYLF